MRRALRRCFDAYLSLLQKTALPRLVDLDHEQRRLNLLRICVGLVVLFRTALIVDAARFYFVDPTTGVLPTVFVFWSIVELALLGMFTLGICTPLATLGLVTTYLTIFEPLMNSFTLATLILQPILICFLFANVGAHFSVDQWLMRRTGSFSKALRRLYGLVGLPSVDTLTVLYSFLFLNFALLSLAAVLFHLDDSYWLAGQTVGVLLRDSYLSSQFAVFRTIAEAAPGPWRLFSITGVVCQTIFQLFMIPLMFLKIGRWFAVLWGLNFLLVSLFFLRLSYLPFVELAIWTLLFLPRPKKKTAEPAPTPVSLLHTGYTAWWLFVCFVFLLQTSVPGWGRVVDHIGFSSWRPGLFLRSHGLESPNVFNRTDLPMSEHWPMLYRVPDSGEPELVPFNGPAGERLAYHRYDELYFGNSLRWRRAMIGQDIRSQHEPGRLGYGLVLRVLLFDHRLQGFDAPVRYRVDVMETRASETALPHDERFEARPLFSYEVLVR
jgi:hypothetical protein